MKEGLAVSMTCILSGKWGISGKPQHINNAVPKPHLKLISEPSSVKIPGNLPPTSLPIRDEVSVAHTVVRPSDFE